MSDVNRREFGRLAGMTAAGCWLAGTCGEDAEAQASAGDGSGRAVPLFDGKTLDGWIDLENNATSLSADQIADPAAFASRLASGTDGVSVMLRGKLEPLVRVDLASYSASNANAKALLSAAVKDINQVLAGPSIYDAARFSGVGLRPET